MPSRDLPARPDLDHLKNEAKALRKAFLRGDSDAVARVEAVLGPTAEPKLTEVQRVLAREHGFPTWARLRAHVQAARGIAEALDAFLRAVANGDKGRALQALEAQPSLASASPHVAAVLGMEAEVRRLIAEDPARVSERAGAFEGDPLLWLCHSPFHGESPDRDDGLAATVRTLLDAGADPNTRDSRYGVPALYAVTGVNNSPRIARMLLDAGAEVDDGESVFHAAERFHEEALELLMEYGVDLNHVGDWGNTPLYFLLRHWDVAREPKVKQGVLWLLAHGADPNVRCDREYRETSLHAAVRVGQQPEIVELLLEHGADVHARGGDGRTAWLLARRSGHDELAALLEDAGAEPEPLSPSDELMVACGRGDAEAARRLTSTELLASLEAADLCLLPHAAAQGRVEVALACLAGGFPIDTTDEMGATALHHAAIHGTARLVQDLLRRGADLRIHDSEHDSPPLGWACFGADFFPEGEGDYEETVRALLEAGAQVTPHVHRARHAGVRQVLGDYAADRG